MEYEEIYSKINNIDVDFLTQQETAALCHLSKKTIYKMERSGKLPYEEHTNRLIHTHRIRREDVLAMLREKYCKLPSGDLYLKAMRQYYHNRLEHEPDILGIQDIIRLTGFSKSGVLKWLASGKLASFRMGCFYKIPKDCLLKFWLSPSYRTIKNKSAVQKADLKAIDMIYQKIRSK